MLTRDTGYIVLALVLSATAVATSVLGQETISDQTKELQQPVVDPSRKLPLPSQEAIVDQSSELQKLRERVGAVEGELRGFNQAITASIQSTDRYTKYLTYVGGAIILILTIVGSLALYWFTSKVKQVETARQQVEQVQNELSISISIARAIPALLRSNLEETDPARKRLHAQEAYRYITQAESKGYTDSHLLNWKAYTLRRMDRREQALEAAQAALKCAKPDDPQKVRALYNIACYYALFGKHKEALDHLDQAILANEWYKGIARHDSDFDSIRKDVNSKQRFEQMVA